MTDSQLTAVLRFAKFTAGATALNHRALLDGNGVAVVTSEATGVTAELIEMMADAAAAGPELLTEIRDLKAQVDALKAAAVEPKAFPMNALKSLVAEAEDAHRPAHGPVAEEHVEPAKDEAAEVHAEQAPVSHTDVE